jgi:hypothetical protein
MMPMTTQVQQEFQQLKHLHQVSMRARTTQQLLGLSNLVLVLGAIWLVVLCNVYATSEPLMTL